MIGMLASTGTVLTTFQTQFEWGIRVTAGIGGIVVTVLTSYNLIKKLKQ
jgi:hypothetical protein